LKKFTLFLILLFTCIGVAQTTSTDSINLQTEINRLKTLRAKDSAKIDLLIQEIRSLISISETQRKEDELKYTQMQDSVNLAKKIAKFSQLQAKSNGIPVVLYADTLFYIYNDLAPFTAQERAENDSDFIKSLYKSKTFVPDSLKIKYTTEEASIIYEDKVITTISELDAIWVENTIINVAEKYKKIIVAEVLKYREKNSINAQIKRIGQLVLFIGLLVGIFYLLDKIVKFLSNKFKTRNHLLAKGITINNYQLVNKQQLSIFVDRLLWLTKFFIFIVTLFIIIPFMLRLFPQTEVWVIHLNQWIRIPFNSVKDSIIDYIPNLVKIILILIIGKVIIKFLRFVSVEIARKRLVFNGFHSEWAKPTFSLLRFVLNIFIIIMIFPLLPGADSIAFKGVSVFLGILLSIGSSSAITNAISGLVITYMRPYRIGDWIKTKETIGVVIEKSLLVTRLRTFNNEDITIPNSSILNDHTINFSSIGKEKGLALSVRVGVRYDYNPGIVEQRLIEAALRTNDITKDIPPYVLHLSLDNLYASYELNAYTLHPENMFFIKSDLTRNVKNVFKEANIELTITNYFEIKPADNLGTNKKNPSN
jgi:small-conductance mechanosensitive channel